MSRLAHVMCEACVEAMAQLWEAADLTDAHAGRECCWCGQVVEFSLILIRHPDAVPCLGRHKEVKA